MPKKIRNFSIIAHIDHGKSTLSDRLLEHTSTIEKRKMKDQVLDQMELERERGITIKMQPVRMQYKDYILNLIDTPGHIDFSYEVSRALKAVEGTILLVDATQGIQAQTLSVLDMARELGLVIIPVLNKIDLPSARPDDVAIEVAELLDCDPESVIRVSGKTGIGVPELLDVIVNKIPAPRDGDESISRGLVFDFQYSSHKGVVVYSRIMDGLIKKGDKLRFMYSGKDFRVLDCGIFAPQEISRPDISAGEIGYVVTGLKEPGVARVGDTIVKSGAKVDPLAGYQEPKPVVWASVYPEDQDDFPVLAQALDRLRLSDSSLSFEEESSLTLGRGFRCGFLGMLHLEIITERLRREFNLSLIIASPTIKYRVVYKDGKEETIYTASQFPDEGAYEQVFEPWVAVTIIVPADYMGGLSQIFHEHEVLVGDTEIFGDERMKISLEMPLRELMRNFFDEVKSVTSGYASLSYDFLDERLANITRLDVLVAEEPVQAFTRVVSKRQAERDGKELVEKLHSILPKQLFDVKIQAKALGRIISSKKLSAARKDVTGHLYGGDVSRKKKLLEKQKKGKKRMKEQGRVQIPQEVFLKMTRNDLS